MKNSVHMCRKIQKIAGFFCQELAPTIWDGELIGKGLPSSFKMSAEPTRRVSYSKDLRWRIVWQRLAKDLKYERIAQNLSISVGSVHNTLTLFEQTGEVDPKKREKREGKLDNYHASYVIGLVLAEPLLKLPELIYRDYS